MSFHDDPDLESRLRRIAAGEPAVPASLYRQLNEMAEGGAHRSINGVDLERVRLAGRGRPGRRSAVALTGLAAVLAVAVAAAGLLTATRGPQAASTLALRADAGQGEWTGLEWHDVTSTAEGLVQGPLYRWGAGGTGALVQWRGGFATLGADLHLWLSKDGITWERAQGAPSYPAAVAIGGDLLVSGQMGDEVSRSFWRTEDGVSWTPVSAPAELSTLSGLAAGNAGVVAETTVDDGSQPPGPSVMYFTRDAKSWTRASLPTDMTDARAVSVSSFIGGFVAIGLVSDPNGSIGYSTDQGPDQYFSYKAWVSRDGLTWTAYDPAVPAGQGRGSEAWMSMQWGRLGAGDGWVYSTDGGATWLADHDLIPNGTATQLVSDGNRIIMVAGSAGRVYLSEGDGRWSLLSQGGDVGSLPADGQLMLLPSGLLWISGSHVYFGQGLSGVTPRGTLGPPTTASPAVPTPAPILESSTPAVSETASPGRAASAAPGSTMTAAGLTTPGVTTGWSGFAWSADPAGSQLDSIRSVQTWSGGYFATTSADPSGPATGLWVSKDAEAWTPVTSIDAGTVFASVAPGGLVAIAVPNDAPYTPGKVWTSSDGVTWNEAGQSDLPGVLVSIAGTSTGIVATVNESADGLSDTYSVLFSKDGLHWTVDPGVGDIQSAMQIPHVQSGNGRFFLTGMAAGPLAGSADSPRFVLDSTVTSDVTLWSDDGVTWTQSRGIYSGFAGTILFGRDGLLLETNYKSTPGGVGLARSSDGGKTWIPDDSFNPLGVADTSQMAGSVGPAGVIASNGSIFLAVSDGGKASISYDGESWSPISWEGSAAQNFGLGPTTGFVVLPRGVVVSGDYGAAR